MDCSRLRIIALALVAGSCGPRASALGEEYVFHHENVMGTSLELRVRADDPGAASRAEGAALGEIDRLAKVFSGYDPSSEFSRWQAAPAGPVRVAPELFEALRESDRWRKASGGGFDPRVEILSRLWSRAADAGREPSREELAAALTRMGAPAWRLDAASGTAERLSDSPLSLNAIAKGLIVERACAVAMASGDGVRGILLNVGGDLRARGEVSWEIGIAPARGDSELSLPIAFLELRDCSVATSGDSQRGWNIGGRHYSHILDPATGRPVERTIQATVIAPQGSDADALATACNVLPVAESLRLVAMVPGAECLLVASDGEIARSPGWGRFERAGKFRTAAYTKGRAAAPEPSWGDENELVVDFEINKPESERRYRRPYVVIWVEDKDGAAVRTLLVWVSMTGAGPDAWLPDLTRWYRSDENGSFAAKKALVYSVGRPTRAPGKYSVAWDGKDDDGKPLGPGEYTISIEAAREHGTHQLIRKQVTIGEKPFAEELKGNVEIKSATINYRRKAEAKK